VVQSSVRRSCFANRAREIWNEINSDQLPEFLAAIHTRAASMQQAQLIEWMDSQLNP
jgi:hypothetical protein